MERDLRGFDDAIEESFPDIGALRLRVSKRGLQVSPLRASRRAVARGIPERRLARGSRENPRGGRSGPGAFGNLPAEARNGAGDHTPDGLFGILSRGGRLHILRQAKRHTRGTGARERGGKPRGLLSRHNGHRSHKTRAHLREVPQSREDKHAGHRRGLLRRAPRRDNKVRDRQVRGGQGGPDRHLRNHVLKGRDKGRRPGARASLRGCRQALETHSHLQGKGLQHRGGGEEGEGREARARRERGTRPRGGGGQVSREHGSATPPPTPRA